MLGTLLFLPDLLTLPRPRPNTGFRGNLRKLCLLLRGEVYFQCRSEYEKNGCVATALNGSGFETELRNAEARD